MSNAASELTGRRRPVARHAGEPHGLRIANPSTFWPLAAIVAAAVWSQIHWGAVENTSWLITVAERMLDGGTAYVDIRETNPPASILIYLPAVMAARLVGVAPEFMVDLFCFVAVFASLSVAGVILARGGLLQSVAGSRLALIATAALLVLPARAFDERDHIAVIASLPCLAALAVRASSGQVDTLLAAIAGLGAGVAMSIKPHFALFFAPNVLYLARRAGWRAALSSPEPYIALALVALYGAAALHWFPAFFDSMLPLQRYIYVPVRRDFGALVADLPFLSWLALITVIVTAARERLAEPLVAVPALASLGAAAAFLIQGKGWPYQAYPALALATLSFGALTFDASRLARRTLALGSVAATALALAYVSLSRPVTYPQLERIVATLAPHPKLMVIGPSIALGFPLTRHVHGEWVGRMHSLWITELSSHALEIGDLDEAAKSRYETYLRFDRELLVADIAERKPDAILIASDMWKSWAFAHADIAATLANYSPIDAVSGVTVYARSDLVALRGTITDEAPYGAPPSGANVSP